MQVSLMPKKAASKPSKTKRIKNAPITTASTKSRSNTPIPNTLQTIRGLPDSVKIYKVPASDNYWVRIYDGNWIKRSTRTTNKVEANAFAKMFYAEWYSNKVNGISTKKNAKQVTTFIKCAEAVIEDNRQLGLREELSQSYVKTQQQVIRNYISQFFKDYDIKDIDYTALNSFKTFLYDQDIKHATIKVQFAALKKIIKYAEMHKRITVRPLFPKLSNDGDARPAFTATEYVHLRKTARSLAKTTFEIRSKLADGTTKKVRNVIITEEIEWLIGFMVYTFIRATDIKTIQLKHLIISEGKFTYLWMPIPTSKKHGKAIVSMPKAVYFYKKILALREKQGIVVSDEDYLFMPEYRNRDTAYRKLTLQLDKILEVANLKQTDTDVDRAMGSLRSSSLMFLAKANTSIRSDVIAKNARTSQDMLDAHYLSTIDNKDFANALHMKDSHKKIKKKKAESKIFTTEAVDMNLRDFANAIDPKKGNKQVIITADGSLKLKE